jgi:hypothetical protein
VIVSDLASSRVGAAGFAGCLVSPVSGCVAFVVCFCSGSSGGIISRTPAIPAARLNNADAPIAAFFLVKCDVKRAIKERFWVAGAGTGGDTVLAGSSTFAALLLASGLSATFGRAETDAVDLCAATGLGGASTAMGSVIRDLRFGRIRNVSDGQFGPGEQGA